MEELKTYYKAQADAQPQPSLTVKPTPVTAQRRTVRKTVLLAAVLVMALGLATAGYAAVTQWFVDRADTGGISEIVIVPDKSQQAVVTVGSDVPENSDRYVILQYSGGLLPFDDETAALVNESLKGMIFTENGEPVEAELERGSHGYMVPITLWRKLFTEAGVPIQILTWEIAEQKLVIWEESLSFHEAVGAYEEAVALLGLAFKVPDLAGFSVELYEYDHQPDRGRKAIYVFMGSAESRFQYYAENTREEGMPFSEWRLTGTIEQIEIGGVTVYKQQDTDGAMGRYFWLDSGVSYCLFYGKDGLDYEAIIANMLS